MAELATRLGSPVTYDRSGDVVWLTTFEYGLQGTVLGTSGAASSGTITPARSNNGPFSLEMDPDNNEDSYVNWKRIIQFLESGKVGAEVCVSVDTGFEAVRLTIWSWDGDNELYAPVDYAEEGGLWKVRDKDLGWVTVLSDYVLQQGPGAWHNIKVVIDTENKTYVRLLVDKEVVVLDSYNLVETESEDLGQIEVRFTNYGCAASHAAVYLDTVIVTQNEP